jgi:hypothetical protein
VHLRRKRGKPIRLLREHENCLHIGKQSLLAKMLRAECQLNPMEKENPDVHKEGMEGRKEWKLNHASGTDY